jgi:hypothetical protein
VARAVRWRCDPMWWREMERIYDALGACVLFISIGTSGTVYPAAGFVLEARAAGAHTVELNLEPSDGADLFVERIEGPAIGNCPVPRRGVSAALSFGRCSTIRGLSAGEVAMSMMTWERAGR